MKKVIVLMILSSALLSGCSPSQIDYNLIQDRNGIAYLPNEPEPVTGTAVASYPSGQQQIVVSYENGKPSGISSEWYANGQMKTEQHFSGEEIGRIRDWYENGEVARDVRVVDGTFVGKNIWSVSEYRTELNMLDGYIHGNFNITDQFGAESWEYENGFEVASSHIETSDNYTYSINRQWEYSSDKTKARVSMENNTSQSKGEPAKIEPNRLGASWIEHNGPSKPKINIKTDRFLITGNVFAQSFNLKTGLSDGLRIGLTDSVLTATLFEQGNLHGYLYFFDRQKAEWEIRDWCYILGVMTWTDHIFYDDESNCKASFQEPNYENLAIPEPFKTLIDQDKKKVSEALIKKVKAEKERKRKAEIEKKEQEEAERKRRIKAEKKRKAEEEKQRLINAKKTEKEKLLAEQKQVKPEITKKIKYKNVTTKQRKVKPESAQYIPVYVPQPQYPRRAQTRGKEGYAVILVTVTTTGGVRDPVMIEEFPEGWGFGRAAVKAANKLKYNPFVIDGQAQEMSGVMYKFTFQMAR